MSPLTIKLLESDSFAPTHSIRSELDALEKGEFHKAILWEYKADDLDCIHLASLMARKDAPKGTGTEFMRNLVRLADLHNRWITLELGNRGHGDNASVYKRTTSSERLKRWYSSFGFKRNASKGLYQLRGTMHRAPKGKYPWK